jgi:putative membrane protein
MDRGPDSRHTGGQPILRDRLAEDRTTLANERTLLAYIRTALTLFVAGVTFIRFFGYAATTVMGWILIPLGIFTLVKGFLSHRKMNRQIRKGRENEPLE